MRAFSRARKASARRISRFTRSRGWLPKQSYEAIAALDEDASVLEAPVLAAREGRVPTTADA